MKAHVMSEVHILSCEAEKTAAVEHYKRNPSFNSSSKLESKKMKIRMAIKAHICCTIFLLVFLACCHIPHMINFDQLVDLIVSYGAEDLKKFLERTGKIENYTSKVAVV